MRPGTGGRRRTRLEHKGGFLLGVLGILIFVLLPLAGLMISRSRSQLHAVARYQDLKKAQQLAGEGYHAGRAALVARDAPAQGKRAVDYGGMEFSLEPVNRTPEVSVYRITAKGTYQDERSLVVALLERRRDGNQVVVATHDQSRMNGVRSGLGPGEVLENRRRQIDSSQSQLDRELQMSERQFLNTIHNQVKALGTQELDEDWDTLVRSLALARGGGPGAPPGRTLAQTPPSGITLASAASVPSKFSSALFPFGLRPSDPVAAADPAPSDGSTAVGEPVTRSPVQPRPEPVGDGGSDSAGGVSNSAPTVPRATSDRVRAPIPQPADPVPPVTRPPADGAGNGGTPVADPLAGAPAPAPRDRAGPGSAASGPPAADPAGSGGTRSGGIGTQSIPDSPTVRAGTGGTRSGLPAAGAAPPPASNPAGTGGTGTASRTIQSVPTTPENSQTR